MDLYLPRDALVVATWGGLTKRLLYDFKQGGATRCAIYLNSH